MICESPFISKDSLIPSVISSVVLYRKHVALFFHPSISVGLSLPCVINWSCCQINLLLFKNPAVSIKCYEVVFESPQKIAHYPAGESEKAFDRI